MSEFREEHLPPTLTLWFCIGCNSMGNFAGCPDGCRMQPMEVVPATMFADLLAMKHELHDKAAALEAVLTRVRMPASAGDDPERIWHTLKSEASKALVTLAASPQHPPIQTPEPDAYFEIERCSACGAVEATQPCLGVCIRKVGEFVACEHYEAMVAEVDLFARHCDESMSLLRRLHNVTARQGQWTENLAYFQAVARKLPLAITRLSVPFKE